MYAKQEIVIQYFREGKSHRTISRELGINRKTVKKYLDDYHDKQSICNSKETGMSEYLSETPLYNTESRGKLRITRESRTVFVNELMKTACSPSGEEHNDWFAFRTARDQYLAAVQ